MVADPRPAGTASSPSGAGDGALEIDLGELTAERVERLEVGWPSEKLAELTLIDTPGLGSADEGTSARTTAALLDEEADGPGEADAVLYLMRHLHRSDVEVPRGFLDRSIPHASPVNAIVVLSRADEIGSARPDALDSARASPPATPPTAAVREPPQGSSRSPA